MPRGSIASSMGHLGGFAIEDGCKKVSNMVLRHLALDAELLIVVLIFCVYPTRPPEGRRQETVAAATFFFFDSLNLTTCETL